VIVLVAAGIAVAVFGALVLLRFPDRPGGKIAWQGFEVSSVGAGLPLIALGVGLLAFASTRDDGGGENPSPARASVTTTSASGPAAGGGACVDEFLADIPAERRATLGVGTNDRKVVGGSAQLEGPIGLLLEDRGAAVGAVRLTYDPDGAPFNVDGIVDAACTPLPEGSHESTAGDVDGDDTTWIQDDEICLDLGAQNYVLEPGGGADVTFGFRRSGCPPS
jgi:hypothetical protein